MNDTNELIDSMLGTNNNEKKYYCKNCGAEYNIHHTQCELCPKCDVEKSVIDHKQIKSGGKQ